MRKKRTAFSTCTLNRSSNNKSLLTDRLFKGRDHFTSLGRDNTVIRSRRERSHDSNNSPLYGFRELKFSRESGEQNQPNFQISF